MKRAILYTLKQTEVDYLPQLDVYRYSPKDYNLLRIGGSGEFLSTPPDLEVVKLNPYHVCKIEKPHTPILNPGPYCKGHRVKETFFYLEPALEEIIKAPFRSECEALKNDVVKLRAESAKWEEGYGDVCRDISYERSRSDYFRKLAEDFNRKPWWKRVIIAFKGLG